MDVAVTTIDGIWCKNILEAIHNGAPKIDYWNSGKLPQNLHMREKVDVFYNTQFLLEGTAKAIYKDQHQNVYSSNKSNLQLIGMDPTCSLSDFEKHLKLVFDNHTIPSQIGNIWIEILTVNFDLANDIMESNAVNIKFSLPSMNQKIKDAKEGTVKDPRFGQITY